jgi:hypothetical protein
MQDRNGYRRDLTAAEQEHLLRAANRPNTNVQAAIVLYENSNPLLVRFSPPGYQETSFAKLGDWLGDQTEVAQNGWAMPGPCALKRTQANVYRLKVICPAEDRLIPISYLLGAVWDPFIENRDVPNKLTWVRVKLPATMWSLQMRWAKNGPAVYDLDASAIHAIGRTRFRHYGIGNVGRGDGYICWGSRIGTMSGIPSVKAVQDLFYGSPFNMDLQERRFYWEPHGLPWMLQNITRRFPKLDRIPARCFTGRGQRGMGNPSTYMERHLTGRV